MKLTVICLAFSLVSADAHSLQFRYTVITTGTHFREFTVAGLLDGEQYIYYHSNGRLITEDWLKKIEGGGHLKRWIEDVKNHQIVVEQDLDPILKYFNSSEGIHTVQIMLGCEFNDDNKTRVYFSCGYGGEDFFSLDGKDSNLIAANTKAKDFINKLKMVYYIQNQKDFLSSKCIYWLLQYMSYGRETLERKVLPEALMFQKFSSSPELVCHPTGFFPSGVMMSWQKDREDLIEDVELRETLPNQDGSFQKRSILNVSPEDLQKHEYICVIKHSSLKEDLVLKARERRILRDGGLDGVLIGIIVGAVVGVLAIIAGILVWKKKSAQ